MIGKLHGNNYSAIIRNVDAFGQQVEYDYLDIRPRLVRIDHPDNSQYVPQADDNWSRISWRFLGNGRYYWVIADYSGALDLFEDLGPVTVDKTRTQLSANLTGSAVITTFNVVRGRELRRGAILRVWKADNSAYIEGSVGAVDALTTAGLVGSCRVTLNSPVTVPGSGIAAIGSRVVERVQKNRAVTIPSVQRALFDALDFGNPLNVLPVM